MSQTKKYAIYCRKSSEDSTKQILSIRSQINELKEFAKRKQLNVVLEPLTEEMSAKKPGRPVFNELMSLVENRTIDGIIAWKLDRLARNPIDGGRVMHSVQQQKLEVITPDRDYNSDELVFLMYVEFGMANQFVNDLGKNTKRGLVTKAKMGYLPSGAKPGYMNDPQSPKGLKKIVKDPDRFPLIQKVFYEILKGLAPSSAFHKLNREWGYTTPIKGKLGGKPMNKSGFYRMLADTFYYGEFEYPQNSGNWYDGKHEPMITRTQFDRIQVILGGKGRKRPHKKDFTYTGFITCGECSASITAEEKWQMICSECKHKFSSRNKTACPKCDLNFDDMQDPKVLHYIYYHCTGKKDPNCTQKSLEVSKFENQLDHLLEKVSISERFKKWAIDYLSELDKFEREKNKTSIRQLQKRYNRCIEKIDWLSECMFNPKNSDESIMTMDEYKRRKKALQDETKEIERLMGRTGDEIRDWLDKAGEFFEFSVYAKRWFNNGDKTKKRRIIQGIGSNITLKDKRLEIELREPFEIIETMAESDPSILQKFEPMKKIGDEGDLEAKWASSSSKLPLQDALQNPRILDSTQIVTAEHIAHLLISQTKLTQI